MKIYGELEKAAFENLAADPTGSGLYKGRCWFNTADATFKFYDGTNVHSFKEVDTNVDNLITLSGVSENDTDLGTFTGSTISDNNDIKGALQELETEFEQETAGINYYSNTPVIAGNSYTNLISQSFTNTISRVYHVFARVNFEDDDGAGSTPEAYYRLGYSTGSGSFPSYTVGRAYGEILTTFPGTYSDMVSSLDTVDLVNTSAITVTSSALSPSQFFDGYVVFDFYVYLAAGTHTFVLQHNEVANENLRSNQMWLRVY